MKISSGLLAFGLLTATSCAPISDPPEYLSVSYMSMPATIAKYDPEGRGFVVVLGSFTPKQMDDARWEFARVKSALGFQCGTNAKLVRRDVRWLKGGSACAKVAYSLYCVPEERWGTDHDHIAPEAYDETVAEALNEPITFPASPNCGEKDGYTVLESEVKRKKINLSPPTVQEIAEREMERLKRRAESNEGTNLAVDPVSSTHSVEIRNVICRPQSMKGFYCKYDMRVVGSSKPSATNWQIRRSVMIKLRDTWDQSEY